MYTAVYTLASDGNVGRSRVRNPAPLYFFFVFYVFISVCDTYQVRTYNKGQHPNKKQNKTRDTCIQQCTPLAAYGQVGVGFSVGW